MGTAQYPPQNILLQHISPLFFATLNEATAPLKTNLRFLGESVALTVTTCGVPPRQIHSGLDERAARKPIVILEAKPNGEGR